MHSHTETQILDAGMYDYAIVTNGRSKTQLYVLCRDRVRFSQFYEKQVLAYLNRCGFTGFFNKPRPTSSDNTRP